MAKVLGGCSVDLEYGTFVFAALGRCPIRDKDITTCFRAYVDQLCEHFVRAETHGSVVHVHCSLAQEDNVD